MEILYVGNAPAIYGGYTDAPDQPRAASSPWAAVIASAERIGFVEPGTSGTSGASVDTAKHSNSRPPAAVALLLGATAQQEASGDAEAFDQRVMQGVMEEQALPEDGTLPSGASTVLLPLAHIGVQAILDAQAKECVFLVSCRVLSCHVVSRWFFALTRIAPILVCALGMLCCAVRRCVVWCRVTARGENREEKYRRRAKQLSQRSIVPAPLLPPPPPVATHAATSASGGGSRRDAVAADHSATSHDAHDARGVPAAASPPSSSPVRLAAPSSSRPPRPSPRHGTANRKAPGSHSGTSTSAAGAGGAGAGAGAGVESALGPGANTGAGAVSTKSGKRVSFMRRVGAMLGISRSAAVSLPPPPSPSPPPPPSSPPPASTSVGFEPRRPPSSPGSPGANDPSFNRVRREATVQVVAPGRHVLHELVAASRGGEESQHQLDGARLGCSTGDNSVSGSSTGTGGTPALGATATAVASVLDEVDLESDFVPPATLGFCESQHHGHHHAPSDHARHHTGPATSFPAPGSSSRSTSTAAAAAAVMLGAAPHVPPAATANAPSTVRHPQRLLPPSMLYAMGIDEFETASPGTATPPGSPAGHECDATLVVSPATTTEWSDEGQTADGTPSSGSTSRSRPIQMPGRGRRRRRNEAFEPDPLDREDTCHVVGSVIVTSADGMPGGMPGLARHAFSNEANDGQSDHGEEQQGTGVRAGFQSDMDTALDNFF